MTTPQQNKYSMYLAVLGVMANYNAVWSALTGVASMVTRLQGFANQIKDATGIQGTPQTGIAQGKNRKNLSMIELAAEVAGDLHSLAVSRGDTEMAAQVDLHVSDLVHLGDTVVAPRCLEIYNMAADPANAAGLLPFNVDAAADTADLKAAIDAYEPLVGKARIATGKKKDARENIEEVEAGADALLHDELDRSMRKQKRKNPSFFSEYTSARMIIDLGIRHEKDPSKTTPEPAK